MKVVPKIEKYMTATPHTVQKNFPLNAAAIFMRDYRIRHLPVLDGGRLVGILTDRDIKLASSLNRPENFMVEEVMTPDPFAVKPEDSLDQVVFQMAEHKYGCAVIVETFGKVVGIFTATDGLRVLGEILIQNYHK